MSGLVSMSSSSAAFAPCDVNRQRRTLFPTNSSISNDKWLRMEPLPVNLTSTLASCCAFSPSSTYTMLDHFALVQRARSMETLSVQRTTSCPLASLKGCLCILKKCRSRHGCHSSVCSRRTCASQGDCTSMPRLFNDDDFSGDAIASVAEFAFVE